MPNHLPPLERLKLLLNSSSPLVIVETVEEMRALEVIRHAAFDLQLPVFEWSVADGLVRYEKKPKRPPGSGSEVQDFLAPVTPDEINVAAGAGSILNTQQPEGMLAHLRTLTIEAVFVLKDFHRHLDSAIVTRRLREAAQDFARGRSTMVITGPAVPLPPEVEALAEYLELPLPDNARLKQIAEETFTRLSKKLSLKRKTLPEDMETIAGNMRGLTEEEAERAIAQAMVARYALCPEVAEEVLQAKKEILRRSGMLEFIDCQESMATVGGLENLKRWLARRKGTWEESARAAGLDLHAASLFWACKDAAKACVRAP